MKRWLTRGLIALALFLLVYGLCYSGLRLAGYLVHQEIARQDTPQGQWLPNHEIARHGVVTGALFDPAQPLGTWLVLTAFHPAACCETAIWTLIRPEYDYRAWYNRLYVWLQNQLWHLRRLLGG